MSWRLELQHIRLAQNLNAFFRHVVHSRLLNDLIRKKTVYIHWYIYMCVHSMVIYIYNTCFYYSLLGILWDDPPPSNSGRTRLMDVWVAIHVFQ